jgi:hypothetical protein
MFEQAEFIEMQQAQGREARNTALRGTRYKNAFIPPMPIEADLPVPQSGIGPHIASYHAAHAHPTSIQNTGTGTNLRSAPDVRSGSSSNFRLTPPEAVGQQKRTPSLFERITGSVQQHIDSFRDEGDGRGDAGQGDAPGASLAKPAQGSLNITAPAAKPAVKDDFDIPAFLRRQAN